MFDSVSILIFFGGYGQIKEAHYKKKKKKKKNTIRTHPQLMHTTKNQYTLSISNKMKCGKNWRVIGIILWSNECSNKFYLYL